MVKSQSFLGIWVIFKICMIQVKVVRIFSWLFNKVKNKNIFEGKLKIELETYDLQGLTQFLLLTESEIIQMSESEKNKLLELINE